VDMNVYPSYEEEDGGGMGSSAKEEDVADMNVYEEKAFVDMNMYPSYEEEEVVNDMNVYEEDADMNVYPSYEEEALNDNNSGELSKFK
ncbi:hypothetical protein A2U01_0060118, partial [Trifolium medium]|nr:hypothetical protein [Trifolium medium]